MIDLCMEPTQGKYQNMLLNFPKTWLEILEDNSDDKRGILYKYCSGYLGNFWLLSENGCRYDRALFRVPCTHLPSIQHKFFRSWLFPFLQTFAPRVALWRKMTDSKIFKISTFSNIIWKCKKNIEIHFRVSLVHLAKWKNNSGLEKLIFRRNKINVAKALSHLKNCGCGRSCGCGCGCKTGSTDTRGWLFWFGPAWLSWLT